MIKARIKELLDEKGLTQYRLSQESGVDNKTLRRLSADGKGINFDTLDKICKALDCSPGEVLVRVTDEKK